MTTKKSKTNSIKEEEIEGFCCFKKMGRCINQGRKKLGSGKVHFTALPPAEPVPGQDQ
jgi:hypothetical protein